jgi:hypothetical protein
MKLLDATGREAQLGQYYPTFRGDMYLLVGAREPHKPSSTGRVYVKVSQDATTTEFFPGVFGMKWAQQ